MNSELTVEGVSYIGNPRSNTAMYITKKVEYLLNNLCRVDNCYIFAERGITVDPLIQRNNHFFFSDNPQREYARFVNELYKERCERERKRKYTHHPDGYYIGENVKVGKNVYIEPNCLIGHDVIIGSNATIMFGTVIRNSIIGDDFIANEHAVIGAFGFTMAEDENHHNFRIPTLGKVLIGNHVEIGAHDNISCGTGGDTVIEDYVKLDALVYVGHDVCLKENVKIAAGGIVGGFVNLGCNVYASLNSNIRNRITVGENSIIGMGSNVIRNVEADVTVAGNPAKALKGGGQ